MRRARLGAGQRSMPCTPLRTLTRAARRQGRFKQRLPVADVLTGQRFERGVRDLPARWLVEAVLIKARAARAYVWHALVLRPSCVCSKLDPCIAM